MGGAQNTRCYYGDGMANSWNCEEFYGNFLKEFKIIKTCYGKSLERGCQPVYKGYCNRPTCIYFSENNLQNVNTTHILADGTIFAYYRKDAPLFFIDVNGINGPNKAGYDAFVFNIHYDGKKIYLSDSIVGALAGVQPGGVAYFSSLEKW